MFVVDNLSSADNMEKLGIIIRLVTAELNETGGLWDFRRFSGDFRKSSGGVAGGVWGLRELGDQGPRNSGGLRGRPGIPGCGGLRVPRSLSRVPGGGLRKSRVVEATRRPPGAIRGVSFFRGLRRPIKEKAPSRRDGDGAKDTMSATDRLSLLRAVLKRSADLNWRCPTRWWRR